MTTVTNKDGIEFDIDAIATDLNGKADVDLSNTNNTAKILMSGQALPSETYIDLTLGASKTLYTAPANGWVSFTTVAASSSSSVIWATAYSSDATPITLWSINSAPPAVGQHMDVTIPVLKNQQFEIGYIDCNAFGSDPYDRFRFYYAVGSESEAS